MAARQGGPCRHPAFGTPSTAPDAGRKVDRRDASPSQKRVRPLDVDAGMLAMIDRLGSADWAHWPEGRTLRAGMHLIQKAVKPGPMDAATDGAGTPREDGEGWRGEATKGPKPYPAPAITRERLMREVLSETPGVVL